MVNLNASGQAVQAHELVAVADRGKRVTGANDAQLPA
jgi:hypothetical protein